MIKPKQLQPGSCKHSSIYLQSKTLIPTHASRRNFTPAGANHFNNELRGESRKRGRDCLEHSDHYDIDMQRETYLYQEEAVRVMTCISDIKLTLTRDLQCRATHLDHLLSHVS